MVHPFGLVFEGKHMPTPIFDTPQDVVWSLTTDSDWKKSKDAKATMSRFERYFQRQAARSPQVGPLVQRSAVPTANYIQPPPPPRFSEGGGGGGNHFRFGNSRGRLPMASIQKQSSSCRGLFQD